MSDEVLTPRALGRATLARQMLLERADVDPVAAVGRLVGLQAQNPLDPYTALWSRIAGFGPLGLSRRIEDRSLVRIVVMRATVHLVTAADCLTLRPLVQRVLDDELRRHPDARALTGRDLRPVVDAVRPFLDEPRSMSAIRAFIAERFPPDEAAGLAYACRNLLPLVQVPPRGLWGRSAQVAYMTAEDWLGRPLDPAPSIDDVVLRYLAVFGPALTADLAAWSRLTGFRAVVDRLRPSLRTFRDERGRELLDLPDAPRPDPRTPAPPRFLPQYDNLLLSHSDRSRFHGPGHAAVMAAAAESWPGTVLLDGTVLGPWRLDRDADGGAATITVTHARPVGRRAAASVVAEGRRLLRMLAPDAGRREVELTPLA